MLKAGVGQIEGAILAADAVVAIDDDFFAVRQFVLAHGQFVHRNQNAVRQAAESGFFRFAYVQQQDIGGCGEFVLQLLRGQLRDVVHNRISVCVNAVCRFQTAFE